MMESSGAEFSLADLFRQEAESQCAVLDEGLLALERNPSDAACLEQLMRAAHSLKGAARIVGLEPLVRLAHAMEDCFVAAQKGTVRLGAEAGDLLLKTNDLLRRMAQATEGEGSSPPELEETLIALQQLLSSESAPPPGAEPPAPPEPRPEPRPAPEEAERVLRVNALHVNRLLGLAGESLVEARWLKPYADALLRLKRQQWSLSRTLEALRDSAPGLDPAARERLATAQRLAMESLQAIGERHGELELYARRATHLSGRLYQEALASRMRPFADGAGGFPRLVRDLARSLGREVRLEIAGEGTPMDREVLEKLEAPLAHLLQNAVDHGMEPPQEREAMGKPREGTIRLEARHVAGALSISVEDDGRGVSMESLGAAIVRRGLATEEMVAGMSTPERLEFLFLPGFSMREAVTQTSGRGVGLDAVKAAIRAVGGQVRVSSRPGRGTRFQMQLPLTLSLLRVLLVEIGGEAYGLPLARVEAAVHAAPEEVEALEGREHIPHGGRRVGLVAAWQLFGGSAPPPQATGQPGVCAVILGERNHPVGLAVERFLGEQEVVVQPLDSRLGKIRNISAGALMRDGAPLLVIDVDDLLRSIETLAFDDGIRSVQPTTGNRGGERRKRVLVVEDSLTVRELERKLLTEAGYEVEVAVDGMDGWNAVRNHEWDLVITDIDMPRLDGIELVRLIRNDARARTVPVMIVSYKDRADDRRRGLEAGADFYLTKGSFHDETLLSAVGDLIGPPAEEAATPAL